MPAADELSQAFRLYEHGALREALAICANQLRKDPDHSETNHLCGLIEYQLGQPQAARLHLERAVKMAPNSALWRSNLSHVLCEAGNLDAAIAQATRATQLNPELAAAHNHLANALKKKGQLDDAIRHYREAVRLEPENAAFLVNLGVALQVGDDMEEAIRHLLHAIKIAPRFASAYANLGAAYLMQQRMDQARDALLEAVRLEPTNTTAVNNLGLALLRMGELHTALKWFEEAISLNPAFGGAHSNLGTAREALGQFEEAVLAYERALELDSDFAIARTNVLKLLCMTENLTRAHRHVREVLNDLARYKDALPSVLRVLQESCDFTKRGQISDLICHLITGGEFDAQAMETALLNLNYEDLPAKLLMECHRAWATAVQPTLGPTPQLAVDRRYAGRRERIRVGYLSPDFRRHATAYFVAPIIEHHDRSRFEIFCYYTLPKSDEWTQSIEASADCFVRVDSLDDRRLAQRIYDDGLDILVDLAGHTRGNRLGALAYRPAPIQVTYLGYPNTTGIDAVDYRLVDRFTLMASDGLGVERPLELTEGLLTYPESPIFARFEDPPCKKRGYTTFGSLNNLSKISTATIRMWARILRRVPGASLLIAYVGADSGIVQANICRAFEEHGVAGHSLRFAGKRPRSEFVMLYNEIDILLDTYPYTGTTTTCEALWMGVPVVTLAGGSIRSRVTGSILKTIGAVDLITETDEHYVDRAVALAADADSLSRLRRELPERMRQSVVGQPKRFTRSLETAYRAAVDTSV